MRFLDKLGMTKWGNKLGMMVLALALGSGALHAQPLELANIFSDHAILQRDADVAIWGWGKPGAKVMVRGSWTSGIVETEVKADGSWVATLSTRHGTPSRLIRDDKSGPYKLHVVCGRERLEVDDIRLGEVWICSGQSNMEMEMRGYGFQGIEGGTEAILASGETADDIRVFNIKTGKKTEPQKDVDASWQLSTPSVTAATSAIGYFFAKRLSQSLGCPVGIIVNAWGGSRIEPWMTREWIDGAGLTKEELEAVNAVEEKADRWPETPELIWNGRVAPIVGYGAKGILWYQGCSNMGQPTCYDKLQNAMVTAWRKAWGCELPFIYTLLAPHDHGDADGRWRPFFVENQMKTADAIPKAWYVSTETLGNKVTVHPAQKREVADLMVMRALQDVYGMDLGIDIEYPLLESVEFGEDGVAKIRLTHVWSNLGSISARDIVGFELAGEDRVFHLAKAEVDWDGDTILVRCADVPKPVAVRYGWRNWMGANLQKTSGIPVPPFRSDDWNY